MSDDEIVAGLLELLDSDVLEEPAEKLVMAAARAIQRKGERKASALMALKSLHEAVHGI